MTKNRLYCGDNLEILATLEAESVDLIYVDPPFFSNRYYEIIWGDEAEIRSFEDRWEGGINVYIDWMKERVMELHRVLKPTGGRILVVKNPTAFAWRYPSVDPNIVYGPYSGKLDNAGEKVEISKPGDEDAGIRYYIRVDRVDYSDGSHPQDCPGGVDLWPTQADGQSKSLTRTSTTRYGNDPNNWTAATPTPGS